MMNGSLSSQEALLERIHAFIVATESNELTEDHWTSFEHLLRESDDACRLYAKYMDMSAMLPSVLEPTGEFLLPDDSLSEQREPVIPFAPTLVPATLHGPTEYFSGWPVAYLIATVIFGIGAMIGSVVTISQVTQPTQVVQQLSPLRSSVVEAKVDLVGRITGMVDRQWADESTATVNGARVPLGRKYDLASGLMEITYDTGAKVILQGPVTYGIESANGGYMSMGKLTGKVEVEKAKGFVVRTPTALVTDLGTEFGVEVDTAGYTTSHVFRGQVNVQATGGDGRPTAAGQVLYAGESAKVNTAGTNRIALLGTSAAAAEFVRELPKRPVKESVPFDLVAYWQFDGQNFLADSSGHGYTLANRGTTQVDGAASFNGAAILSTIDSVDLTPYKKIRVSWSQRAVGPFTEEIVWEQTPNYCHTPGAIVSHLTAQEGYTGVATQHLGKESYRLESYPVVSDTWEHFVMECDLTAVKRSGIVKVFKNGMQIGRGTPAFGPAPESFVSAPVFIGSRDGLIAPFVGQIDNLKIEGEPVKKGR
jgi:hypothetical protein